MPNAVLILIVVAYSLGVIALIFMHFKYMKLLSDLKQSKKEAYYDSYTGLASNDMFKDNLTYIINSTKDNSKLVVMSLDLESLNGLGEILGEDNGGLLLKESINRIKSCIRSTDLITKTDTNEFFIMLTRVTNYRDIQMVAQRILGVFHEPFSLRARDFILTASVGIAVYPENGKDVELLMKNADAAKHKAKTSGSNNFFFYADDLNHQSKKYDLMVKDMKTALKLNEFYLTYQPQYDLNLKRVIGVEALIRWKHPTRGVISPTEFIPVAESSGLIVPLGYWVLKTACKQYKEWGMPDLKLSVNLSAYQFKQKDLTQKIKDIIEQESMNPEKVNLEITESTSMSDINFTLKVLNELRGMGLLLSIDDFGTGYSSLSYLKQFPITTLKIDRSFIKDIAKDKNGEVVIKTVIDLAKNLELKVVAEGVETEEQLAFLKELSCDKIQGYILSPPITSEEFLMSMKQGTLTLDVA